MPHAFVDTGDYYDMTNIMMGFYVGTQNDRIPFNNPLDVLCHTSLKNRWLHLNFVE
uniref:Uncharacterized protein n=1 Tax=Arundo donax TaxID=35708 RepID=A0A0A9AW98_ARUDO